MIRSGLLSVRLGWPLCCVVRRRMLLLETAGRAKPSCRRCWFFAYLPCRVSGAFPRRMCAGLGQTFKIWNVAGTKAARIADASDIRLLFTAIVPLDREKCPLGFRRGIGLPHLAEPRRLTRQRGTLTGYERILPLSGPGALTKRMSGEQTPPESLTNGTSRFVRRKMLGSSQSHPQASPDGGLNRASNGSDARARFRSR